MADITLQGASYTGVPWVDLPKTGGGTARFVDVSEMDDYVVEHGTSGIWEYRIWNSGKVDLWGKTSTITATSWTQWGTTIIRYSLVGSQTAYPANIFATAPNATATWVSETSDCWTSQTGGNSTTAPELYLYRPVSTNSATGHIEYMVHGTLSSHWSS